MPKNLAELIAWTKSHQGRKIIRFTSVSVISTVVSNVSLFILYYPKFVTNEILATFLGNLIATLPAYNLNRRWTWGKTGKSHWRKEIVPFWAMSLVGILFSTFISQFAKQLVHHHPHWGQSINSLILMGFNLASFGIFWVLKMALFNRIFHTNELAEMDEHLTAEEKGNLAR